MAKRNNVSVVHAITPILTMVRKSTVLVLMFLSLIIAFISQSDHPFAVGPRTFVTDIIVVMYDIALSPMDNITSAAQAISDWTGVYEDNKMLRENAKATENISYRLWLAEQENRRLRQALEFTDMVPFSVRTVRMVGGSDLFRRHGYINLGTRGGIEKGQVVIDGNGLIGRVQEVGQLSAKVVMISDINSKVPVLVVSQDTGERYKAIIAGNNTKFLSLQHFPVEHSIGIGDMILTSGDGEFFPPDILVGEVARIGREQISVEPAAHLNVTDIIHVIDKMVVIPPATDELVEQ